MSVQSIHGDASGGSYQPLTQKGYFNGAQIRVNHVLRVQVFLGGCPWLLLPGKCLPSTLPNLQKELLGLLRPGPSQDFRVLQNPGKAWTWAQGQDHTLD